MCLTMCDKKDLKLLNLFRKKGHVLVKGWKQVALTSGGAIRSQIMSYYWVSGWNKAISGGRYLTARRFKPRKVKGCSREINAGFHVYVKRPIPYWRTDVVTRTVWFYADEVRGAEDRYGCKTVVVNHVCMNRAY